MILVRRIARPMLASPFLVAGVEAVKHPVTTDAISERAAQAVVKRIPKIPEPEAETAVRIEGAVMTGAAVLLALGRAPRIASIALLATVLPPLVERAREIRSDEKSGDPAERAEKRMQLLGQIGVVGGLLIAAADTAGKPSMGRRAASTSRHTRRAIEHAAHSAQRELKHTAREAALTAKVAASKV
jgi:putative oxidoreductase